MASDKVGGVGLSIHQWKGEIYLGLSENRGIKLDFRLEMDKSDSKPVKMEPPPNPTVDHHFLLWNGHIYIYNIYIYDCIILRQDPEVCPNSQRASGYDDDGDDDDDDDDDDDHHHHHHRYAPHKQHELDPYWRSWLNVEVKRGWEN